MPPSLSFLPSLSCSVTQCLTVQRTATPLLLQGLLGLLAELLLLGLLAELQLIAAACVE